MYSNEDHLLEVLVDASLVTNDDIETARSQARGTESVVDVLTRMGLVTDIDVARTAAYQSGMEFVDLAVVHPQPDAIPAVTKDIAKRYKILPINFEGATLTVAVTNPFDFETLDSLPFVLKNELQFVCATPEQIRQNFLTYYGDEEDLKASIDGQGVEFGEEASEAGDDAPIIRLVSNMLMEAFKGRSSDIHIEPLEKSLRIRYRIDGVLHEIDNHPLKLHAAVIARIKIMTGSMSIDEKRLPQDGRIQVKVSGRELDLRVSTIPTNHGESVVMRILDKSGLKLGLAELGFLSDDEETFDGLIRLPDGILLVTGPTGSGKTTTLYACLNTINKPDRKIITVEDPVEYQLDGINQVQVREDVGMTFAAALRSILRQAPNIIMIGEIRDLETASIAINASLTGHLVFSTLHTNDAPSAVARLADIGVKPFLVSSAVRAIMAQRLVRKLCKECKEPGSMTQTEMRALGIDPIQLADATIMGPKGCQTCRGTGFRGRLAVIEVFKVDDEARHMINQNLSTPQLRKRARELGMRTLREDGVRKALAGMTTAGEVIKVTMSDSH